MDEYININKQDYVVVMYTPDALGPVAWVCAALECRGIQFRRVWMQPLKDELFGESLREALPAPATLDGRLLILSFERDTMSHTTVLANCPAKYPRDRLLTYRTISASAELFSTALRALPRELEARNTALLERLLAARHLRITTEGGTDLRIRLAPNVHRWISNRGHAMPGRTIILPAGEVATFPDYVEGVFVANFVFNLNAVVDRDARLNHHPVRVEIRENKVDLIHCDDPGTMAFIKQCMAMSCSVRIGELGFGTNHWVTEPIALNSHVNERRPGVHIGLGQHNQDPRVVGYQCPIHLDLIARGGLVWIDDEAEPLDLEALPTANGSHPASTRDEDVFSPEPPEQVLEGDCCGTGDGPVMGCPLPPAL